jgi:putative heme-binding domain-containing protein
MITALDRGLCDRPTGNGSHSGTLFTNFAAAEPKPAAARVLSEAIPAVLEEQLSALWKDHPSEPALLCLLARLGRANAQERACILAVDANTPIEIRLKLLQALGEVAEPGYVVPLLKLITGRQTSLAPEAVRLAALEALQRLNQGEIAAQLLQAYLNMPGRLRARTTEILLTRRSWALQLLKEIDRGNIPAKEVGVDQLRLVALHKDKQLDQLVRKHWGNIQGGTAEEKLAEMRRLSNDLRASSGNPMLGRELFKKHCATCHRLFDDGNILGPDLTHSNRHDRDYLLVNIVDPSAVIRKEFLSYNVQTRDGRLLTGLIAEQSPAGLTLLGANNQRTVIARDKIERIDDSAISLMPENLLKELKPQDLRDLFSYLQSK